MLKKALAFAALAAASGAALANPPHWAPAHGYRAHQTYHYQPQVRYYTVAPRPMYVARPVYVAPRPVYVAPAPVVYAPRPDAGAILFGALLGGVIAHQIVTH
jgi:hypothetical protein